MALAKIGFDARDHSVAYLIQCIHVSDSLLVTVSNLEAGVVKRLPGTVAAGQRQRGGLAHLPHPERENEPLERNPPSLLDGAEQIAHRGLPVAFMLFELDVGVSRGKRK